MNYLFYMLFSIILNCNIVLKELEELIVVNY